jgi:hypothetical protein
MATFLRLQVQILATLHCVFSILLVLLLVLLVKLALLFAWRLGAAGRRFSYYRPPSPDDWWRGV